MKDAFTSAPILCTWSLDLPTCLETDASGYATGRVLPQKQADGLWHPVAFWSSSMQEAERSNQIYDQELLAIIEALKEW